MSHKSYVQTGNATTITGTKTPDDIDNETHKSGVEHTPVETSSGPTSSAEMKKIASPVRAEVLLAAVKFAEAALQADLEYAVVGGVSAVVGRVRAARDRSRPRARRFHKPVDVRGRYANSRWMA